jgi:hypothetical protein
MTNLVQTQFLIDIVAIALEALVEFGYLPEQREVAEEYRSRILAKLQESGIGAEFES